MKRIASFVALTLVVIPVLAQKIDMDSEKENGNRVICTEQIGFGLQKKFMGIPVAEGGERYLTVGCIIIENDTLFSVGLSLSRYQERMTLAKGKSLLLKLDNDEVMTLTTSVDITLADNTFTVTSLMGVTGTHYHISPNYRISKEQIALLKEHKVKKIRIETEWEEGYIDDDGKAYKKLWDFSGAVIKGYEAIQARLAKSKKSQLYDNF